MQLQRKAEELETVALEAITCNHHLRMAKDALKNNNPPKGLTPTMFLTAHKQSKELTDAVNAELTQCGLKICSHLVAHYSTLLADANKSMGELQIELNQIADSAESQEQITALKSKVEYHLTNINNKCERKATQFKETFQKKRSRDTNTEQPSTSKHPRLDKLELNSTTDRDAAITNLFQVVNDVSNNQQPHSLSINNSLLPTVSHKATRTRPWLRPWTRKRQRKPKRRKRTRPPLLTRKTLKKHKHRTNYRTKHRHKHNPSANIYC